MYAVRNGAFRATGNALRADAATYDESAEQAENRMLAQWIARKSHVVIADYAPQSDEILLVYEAKHHPNPLVSLDLSEAPLWAKVQIDGIEIAKVNLPLTLADIRLVPI